MKEGILLIPQTTETSCYYGAQTSWCTARRDINNLFEKYSKQGNIYTWFDKILQDKFQFHFEKLEFKDRNNDHISKERFKEFREHPVLKIIFDEGLEKVKKLEMSSQIGFTKFYPEWKEYLKTQEDKIIKVPNLVSLYVTDVIQGRWPEAEKYFIENNKWSSFLQYSKLINQKIPELENGLLKNIQTNPNIDSAAVASRYARDIIKGRWKELEELLFELYATGKYDFGLWSHYVLEVLNQKRLSDLEALMILPLFHKDILDYFTTIGSTVKELEPFIPKEQMKEYEQFLSEISG